MVTLFSRRYIYLGSAGNDVTIQRAQATNKFYQRNINKFHSCKKLMGFECGQYLIEEWRKCCEHVEEPNDSEKLILSCGFQELLRKLVLEAQNNARRDGFSEVKPGHLEAALEDLLHI
ncbi:WIP1 (YDR374W-A) [Zygosaccharomyces parabailii]|nr:WIP1 (YDR374W-A) [Zygosaccharomyces parabailii]AQZ11009.1 WIP1 (YDR374W-A) [Zygosaccharomyces parabailii]